MILDRDISTSFLGLGFLLILSFLLSPGCQTLQKPKRSHKDNRWICPEFADAPLRQGRFEEAIEQHLKVLSQEPDNGLAHYHLGYAYGQLGLHADETASNDGNILHWHNFII